MRGGRLRRGWRKSGARINKEEIEAEDAWRKKKR